MTANIEAIFLDVGNTLRIVLEEPEFQQKAKLGLMELVGTTKTEEEFFAEVEARWSTYRKTSKKSLKEASERDLWCLHLLPDYPAEQIVGVMLTGMGYDGADAMAEVRRRGGKTIAESEETAVVFGMPAELIQRGGATVVAPCDQIAKHLLHWLL